MRSKIEMYWNGVDTAPAEVPLQVLVNDGSGSDYLLPYPCKLMVSAKCPRKLVPN